MLVMGVSGSLAAERSTLGQRWEAHDEAAMARIDHGAWERFLVRYIRPGGDGVHRLAYGRVSEGHKRDLASYLGHLSEVNIAAYRRAEQLAFWINLYNALTVDLVLDHYPIASLRRLSLEHGGSAVGAWDYPVIEMDGVRLSLNDIELGVIGSIWQDPRIRYALSCAAIGCPNLQPVPFTGDRIDQQLSDAAMDFVNDSRCIEVADGKLYISSLFRWNYQAFGGSDRAVINHLMAYADPDMAMRLQEFDHVHGDLFDWRLNDAGGP